MANNDSKRFTLPDWLLVIGVVLLAVAPVIFVRGEFIGSDQQGTEAIEKIRPGYKPWFQSVIVLPSAEVERLMFSMQAVLGAGVVGFVIGHYRGRSRVKGRNKASKIP